METLKKEFAELKKAYKKIEALKGTASNSYYYEAENFTELLRKFLHLEFTKLSKKDFLWLCDRVSTYRPVAPFAFLVSISNRKPKKKVQKVN